MVSESKIGSPIHSNYTATYKSIENINVKLKKSYIHMQCPFKTIKRERM